MWMKPCRWKVRHTARPGEKPGDDEHGESEACSYAGLHILLGPHDRRHINQEPGEDENQRREEAPDMRLDASTFGS